MSSIPRGVWKLDPVCDKSNLKCLPCVGKRPLRWSRAVLSRLFFRRSSRLQQSPENLWSGADSDHFTYKVWKIAAEFRILGFPVKVYTLLSLKTYLGQDGLLPWVNKGMTAPTPPPPPPGPPPPPPPPPPWPPSHTRQHDLDTEMTIIVKVRVRVRVLKMTSYSGQRRNDDNRHFGVVIMLHAPSVSFRVHQPSVACVLNFQPLCYF